jgi:hypothetical protein
MCALLNRSEGKWGTLLIGTKERMFISRATSASTGFKEELPPDFRGAKFGNMYLLWKQKALGYRVKQFAGRRHRGTPDVESSQTRTQTYFIGRRSRTKDSRRDKDLHYNLNTTQCAVKCCSFILMCYLQ